MITWNPANWITVVLMVMVFYAVVSFGVRLVKGPDDMMGDA